MIIGQYFSPPFDLIPLSLVLTFLPTWLSTNIILTTTKLEKKKRKLVERVGTRLAILSSKYGNKIRFFRLFNSDLWLFKQLIQTINSTCCTKQWRKTSRNIRRSFRDNYFSTSVRSVCYIMSLRPTCRNFSSFFPLPPFFSIRPENISEQRILFWG